MPQADFSETGVVLHLSPEEYGFIHQALSYVLYGVEVPDFRILMAMERGAAETVAEEIAQQEREARQRGAHW